MVIPVFLFSLSCFADQFAFSYNKGANPLVHIDVSRQQLDYWHPSRSQDLDLMYFSGESHGLVLGLIHAKKEQGFAQAPYSANTQFESDYKYSGIKVGIGLRIQLNILG